MSKIKIEFLLIMSVAIFLRLYHLGYQSLWLDETHKIFNALKPAPEIVAQSVQNLDAPYHLMLHYWILMVGTSEVGVRLFSCVAGILFVALLYFVSADLLSPKGQAPALILAAVSPIQIYYSQEAAVYALVMLASLVSLWTFYRSLRDNTWPWWSSYLASTLFLNYVHAHGLFVTAAEVVYFVFFWRRYKIIWKSFVLVQTALGILCLPKVVLLLQQVRIDANPWIPSLHWSYPLQTFASFTLLGWRIPRTDVVLLALYIGLPLFGLVLTWGILKGVGQRVYLAFILFVPMILTVLTSFRKPNYYPGRYEVIVFPALVLLLASGFSAISRTRWRMLCAILLLGALSLSLWTYYFVYYKSNDREVARIIRSEATADDVLVFTDLLIVSGYYYLDRTEYPHFVSFLPYYHQGWLSRRALSPDPDYGALRARELRARIDPLMSPDNKLLVLDFPIPVNRYLFTSLSEDYELIKKIPVRPGHNTNQITMIHIYRLRTKS